MTNALTAAAAIPEDFDRDEDLYHLPENGGMPAADWNKLNELFDAPLLRQKAFSELLIPHVSQAAPKLPAGVLHVIVEYVRVPPLPTALRNKIKMQKELEMQLQRVALDNEACMHFTFPPRASPCCVPSVDAVRLSLERREREQQELLAARLRERQAQQQTVRALAAQARARFGAQTPAQAAALAEAGVVGAIVAAEERILVPLQFIVFVALRFTGDPSFRMRATILSCTATAMATNWNPRLLPMSKRSAELLADSTAHSGPSSFAGHGTAEAARGGAAQVPAAVRPRPGRH